MSRVNWGASEVGAFAAEKQYGASSTIRTVRNKNKRRTALPYLAITSTRDDLGPIGLFGTLIIVVVFFYLFLVSRLFFEV